MEVGWVEVEKAVLSGSGIGSKGSHPDAGPAAGYLWPDLLFPAPLMALLEPRTQGQPEQMQNTCVLRV